MRFETLRACRPSPIRPALATIIIILFPMVLTIERNGRQPAFGWVPHSQLASVLRYGKAGEWCIGGLNHGYRGLERLRGGGWGWEVVGSDDEERMRWEEERKDDWSLDQVSDAPDKFPKNLTGWPLKINEIPVFSSNQQHPTTPKGSAYIISTQRPSRQAWMNLTFTHALAPLTHRIVSIPLSPNIPTVTWPADSPVRHVLRQAIGDGEVTSGTATLPQRMFDVHLSKGEISRFSAHWRAWGMIARSLDNEVEIVVEDDIIPYPYVPPPTSSLKKAIMERWQDIYHAITSEAGRATNHSISWDIIYLARHEFEGSPPTKAMNGQQAPGVFAYALNRKGANKLLRAVEDRNISLPSLSAFLASLSPLHFTAINCEEDIVDTLQGALDNSLLAGDHPFARFITGGVNGARVNPEARPHNPTRDGRQSSSTLKGRVRETSLLKFLRAFSGTEETLKDMGVEPFETHTRALEDYYQAIMQAAMDTRDGSPFPSSRIPGIETLGESRGVSVLNMYFLDSKDAQNLLASRPPHSDQENETEIDKYWKRLALLRHAEVARSPPSPPLFLSPLSWRKTALQTIEAQPFRPENIKKMKSREIIKPSPLRTRIDALVALAQSKGHPLPTLSSLSPPAHLPGVERGVLRQGSPNWSFWGVLEKGKGRILGKIQGGEGVEIQGGADGYGGYVNGGYDSEPIVGILKEDEEMMENVSMYIKLPDLLAKDPISRVANFRSKPKNLTSLPPHKRSEYTTKTTPPGKKVRIGDWRWIQIEPAASGEKLTTDHHHLSLSSTLLSGRRLWCIFPGISGESRDPAPSRVSEDVSEHPERSFPGISRESLGEVSGGLSEIFGVSPGTSRTDNVEKILEPSRTLSQTALEWLEDYTRSSFAKSSLCFWNIQEAGESVVIPSGWRHTSISVEPSVSFRQRFILPSDFSSVVRSSKTSTQIARGRVHSKIVEAIKRLSARSQTDTRDTSN